MFLGYVFSISVFRTFMIASLLRLLLVGACGISVQGYSSGGASLGCSLPATPNHAGSSNSVPAQTYELVLRDPSTGAVSAYVPGRTYTLDIKSVTGATTFKGFAIGTANAGGQTPALKVLDAGVMKLGCSSSNIVTHTSSASKTLVSASWVAPSSGAGTVTFTGTVLQEYSAYAFVSLVVPESVSQEPSSTPTVSTTASLSGSPTPSPTATMSQGSSPSMTPSATLTPSYSSSPTPSSSRSPSVALSYPFSVSLSPAGLKLEWDILPAGTAGAPPSGLLLCRLTSPSAGWAGIALNTAPNVMAGGDALTVYPALVPAAVTQLVLTSSGAAGVVTVPAAQSSLLPNTSFTLVAGGGWVATFARPLAAGSYPGALAVPSVTYLTSAWGNSPQKSSHPSSATSSFAVDLIRGTATLVSRAPLIIAHGALMAIAWVILFPAGAFIARFGKRLEPTSGAAAQWFVLHRYLQSFGWVALVAAFACSVAAVSTRGAVHFATTHAAVGFAAFLFAVIQPLNACVRPARAVPSGPTPLPRRVWEAWHKGVGWVVLGALAPAAIFLGLADAGASIGWTIAYAVAFGATVVCAVVLEVRRVRADAFERDKCIRLPATAPRVASSGDSNSVELTKGPARSRNNSNAPPSMRGLESDAFVNDNPTAPKSSVGGSV